MVNRGLKSSFVVMVMVMVMGVVVVVVGGEAVHPSQHYLYHPSLFNPSPSLLHAPSAVHPITYAGVEAVRVAATESDLQLLCQREGFHTHPTNCSRFYRCVDFVGTGLVFSLYMFECPKDHVFAAEISSCVPGTICENPSIPPSIPEQPPSIPEQPPSIPPSIPEQPPSIPPTIPEQPPSIPPSIPEQPPSIPPTIPEQPPSIPTIQEQPPSIPPTIPEQPPSIPTIPEQPPSIPEQPPTIPEQPPTIPEQPPSIPPSIPEQPPSIPPTIPEQPPSIPSVPPTIPPSIPEAPTPLPEPSTDEKCTTVYYYQHQDYCNVYYLCSNTTLRYVCTLGTVFDEQRQMCRISAVDEGLCMGKAILPPSLLRTELVEGHLLLPTDLSLPPLIRSAFVQSLPRPIALLQPLPHSHTKNQPLPHFHTQTQPLHLSPTRTQQRPLSHTQIQQNQLHQFPYFQPLPHSPTQVQPLPASHHPTQFQSLPHPHTRPLVTHGTPFVGSVVRTQTSGGDSYLGNPLGQLMHFPSPNFFPYQFPLIQP
ncbi:hypothetical protein Pmani_019421 [Petrolisthes manimaculis]|uniref:Chitin-binding type-2 domain-containing protein n=1 Tax=Petrolisthes manimaculis TaxID=1843537 RepID=A0AAE1U3Z5_9EUCA|nr:hypothetical protein Pmani_019421 [Petrolisthes manimaculis]